MQILTQALSFSRRHWSLYHPEGGLSVATGAVVLQRHVVLCLTSDRAQCLHQGDFLGMLVSRHFTFFQADTHVIFLPAEKPLSAAAGTNTHIQESNTSITNFMLVWSGINPQIRLCPTIPPDDDDQKYFWISQSLLAQMTHCMLVFYLFPCKHVRSGYLWSWRWEECRFESPLNWSEKLT